MEAISNVPLTSRLCTDDTLTKLDQLDSAVSLEELRVPPGNHLEALSGSREGQYCIRINAQYRVCFKWIDRESDEVEIVDYH